MNINDSRYGSNGMVNQPGCPATPATQLAANTWHCIEGYFDGTKGDFRFFANGTEVITQTAAWRVRSSRSPRFASAIASTTRTTETSGTTI